MKNFFQLIPMKRFELSQKFTSCDTYRKFADVEILAEKSQKYDDAIVMLDIFRGVLWDKEFDLDEVFTLCAENNGLDLSMLQDMNGSAAEFDADMENIRLKTMTDSMHYTRFLREELVRNRENLMVSKKLPRLEVQIGNYAVDATPQALFLSRPNGKAVLEAAFFGDKAAPSFTSSTLMEELAKAGKKGPNPEKRQRILSIWLNEYCALKYVQELLANPDMLNLLGIDEGEAVTGIGSMYYMQFRDDAKITFYGNPGSVVSLTEEFTAGKDVTRLSDEDKAYDEFAKAHELGVPEDKCTEDDCRWCSQRPSCRFTKSPVHIASEEKKEEKKSSFEPTEEQKILLNLIAQITLCIARAGGGKTAMAMKILCNWIAAGVDPIHILMLTFTKNAVAEFKKRVLEEEEQGELCNYNTFHGFALNIIKHFYEELGYTSIPREPNPVDNARIINDLLKDRKIPGDEKLYQKNFSGTLNITEIAIRVFEALGENPDVPASMSMIDQTARAYCTPATLTALEDAYSDYLKAMKEDNIILFSQMEPLMHQILKQHPDYLKSLGYTHIIVDEFQDSSDIQMDTVKALVDCFDDDRDRLLCIGDDWQSIYGWRKGNVENITRFEEKLGRPVNTVTMLTNWRCRPEILELADDLIALNVEQTAERTIAGRPSGEKPVVKGFHSEAEEYKFIVDRIQYHFHEEHVPYHNQVIEARTNAELGRIAVYLADAGIPYVFKSPVKYAENSRVKAAIAFTRNVFWAPETTEGYYAFLAAKYDGCMLEELDADEVREEMADLFSKFRDIDSLPLEAQKALWKEKLDELRMNDEVYDSFLDDYVFSYPEIEEELQFISDFQKYGSKMAMRMKDNYEGVVLVTAHSAKGLEWKIVYNTITHFDKPILHSSSKFHDEVEETRRLLYVSMTRAKDMLYVTGQYILPGTKSIPKKNGGPVYNQFLQEIMELAGEVYDPTDPKELEKKKKREAKAAERRSNTKTSEMTEEQKATYNKRVRGSYQVSMDDFLKQKQ